MVAHSPARQKDWETGREGSHQAGSTACLEGDQGFDLSASLVVTSRAS